MELGGRGLGDLVHIRCEFVFVVGLVCVGNGGGGGALEDYKGLPRGKNVDV